MGSAWKLRMHFCSTASALWELRLQICSVCPAFCNPQFAKHPSWPHIFLHPLPCRLRYLAPWQYLDLHILFCWSRCWTEWSSVPRPAAWLLALVLTPTHSFQIFSVLKLNNAQDCCCPLWLRSLWWLWNPWNCSGHGSSDERWCRGCSFRILKEDDKMKVIFMQYDLQWKERINMC